MENKNHWIKDGTYLVCPNCGDTNECYDGGGVTWPFWVYCPSCGSYNGSEKDAIIEEKTE